MNAPRNWLQIRRSRLTSDQRRLRELAAASDLISIEEVTGDPPEHYIFHYRCFGVVAPGHDEPVLSENHRVEVVLPIEYPTKHPQMRWLTPLFHPNVNEEGTYVCIDVWYPSKFLDDLCLMLGRMIQYRNYNPYSFVRLNAALWSRDERRRFPVDRRPLRRGEARTAEFEEVEIRFL